MNPAIRRIHDPASPDDGLRVLIDRLWPRGISKQRAGVDVWLREVAPSSGLRQWFGHDPARWDEFKQRYWDELRVEPAATAVARLRLLAIQGRVTLLFAAKDENHNNALALGEFLQTES